MPNEQTSVPLFASGEVLTASNLNLSAGTGVPVFLNSTTRDAGFGGSGEKVLAEGQLCYLSSTNVVQYYDGAAWATVGPSSGAGLVFLTSASFSASSAVNLAASTFSATYSNYKIVFDITAASSNGTRFNSRLRIAGADNSTANYANSAIGSIVSADAISYVRADFASEWSFGYLSSGDLNALTLDLIGPFASQSTKVLSAAMGRGSAGAVAPHVGGGAFNAATSFDALSVYPAAGNITGSYKVYGYANS